MHFHETFTYDVARAEHDVRIRPAELYRHLQPHHLRPPRRAVRVIAGPTVAVLVVLSLVLR